MGLKVGGGGAQTLSASLNKTFPSFVTFKVVVNQQTTKTTNVLHYTIKLVYKKSSSCISVAHFKTLVSCLEHYFEQFTEWIMISALLDRWSRVNYRCTSVDLFVMAGYQYLHCVIHLTDYRTNGRKETNVLFNDAINTFHLRLYGIRHMVKDHSDSKRGEREMFYLTTHSTHLIYGYMASDIW